MATGYHLFYEVKNSKSEYFEIKYFTSKTRALSEALKLNMCSNVVKIIIKKIKFSIEDTEIIKE